MGHKASGKSKKTRTAIAQLKGEVEDVGKAKAKKRKFAYKDENHLERATNASAVVATLRESLIEDYGEDGKEIFTIIQSHVKAGQAYGYNNLCREIIYAR